MQTATPTDFLTSKKTVKEVTTILNSNSWDFVFNGQINQNTIDEAIHILDTKKKLIAEVEHSISKIDGQEFQWYCEENDTEKSDVQKLAEMIADDVAKQTLKRYRLTDTLENITFSIF